MNDGCKFYETCNLRKNTPYRFLKEYESYFCHGGDDAVAECQHRSALLKIQRLESQLEKQNTPLGWRS